MARREFPSCGFCQQLSLCHLFSQFFWTLLWEEAASFPQAILSSWVYGLFLQSFESSASWFSTEASKSKQGWTPSNLLLKIVNLLRQQLSKCGAVHGFVIQAGFGRKIAAAAGKNVLDENPLAFEAARRGRQQQLRCPAPAPGPGVQPGKNISRNCRHRSRSQNSLFLPAWIMRMGSCLCFRNPAKFVTRSSFLLTCTCKSRAFLKYLPLILSLSTPKMRWSVTAWCGALKVQRARAQESQSHWLLGRKHPLSPPSWTGPSPTCWYF